MNFIKLYIYLGLELNRIDFNALSKNSKSFLCLFLKNVFYLKNTPLKLTYNKIKSIFNKNGKKSFFSHEMLRISLSCNNSLQKNMKHIIVTACKLYSFLQESEIVHQLLIDLSQSECSILFQGRNLSNLPTPRTPCLHLSPRSKRLLALTRLLIPNNKISQRLELRVLVPEVSHPLFGISTNKEHRHGICQSLSNPRAHAMPMMMTYVLSSN